MNIGSAIKKIRQKKEIKQITLAKDANISASYLSEIENGKKKPDVNVISRICKSLGIQIPLLYFAAFEKKEMDVSNKQEVIQNLRILVTINPSFLNYIYKTIDLLKIEQELFVNNIKDWDMREN